MRVSRFRPVLTARSCFLLIVLFFLFGGVEPYPMVWPFLMMCYERETTDPADDFNSAAALSTCSLARLLSERVVGGVHGLHRVDDHLFEYLEVDVCLLYTSDAADE